MMITAYLKYEKKPETKSRFNLVFYSEPIYESEQFKPLDKPFIYIGKNPHIKSRSERNPELSIACNLKHISSIYHFETTKPEFAYGDINRTNDLMLFILNGLEIEMFILRGFKNHLHTILNYFVEGELSEEMEYFRNRAVNYTPEVQVLNSQSL